MTHSTKNFGNHFVCAKISESSKFACVQYAQRIFALNFCSVRHMMSESKNICLTALLSAKSKIVYKWNEAVTHYNPEFLFFSSFWCRFIYLFPTGKKMSSLKLCVEAFPSNVSCVRRLDVVSNNARHIGNRVSTTKTKTMGKVHTSTHTHTLFIRWIE